MRPRFDSFLRDLTSGLVRPRLWISLGAVEFSLKYKSTALGVLWHPLLLTIKLIALTEIFSRLFGRTAAEYLPFLGLGLVTWNLISSLIHLSCTIFIKAATHLEQIRCSTAVFVLKGLVSELAGFTISLVCALVLIQLYSGVLHWRYLPWSLLGAGSIGLAGGLLCYSLGTLCSRYRDVIHAVNSLMNIAFLLSPVLWPPMSELAGNPWLYLNPFHHFLAVVRFPLIYGGIPVTSLLVCGFLSLALLVLAAMVFNRFRSHILFWALVK